MPAPETSLDFLDLVRRSGLVPAERLGTALRRFPSPSDEAIEKLADELVRSGLLTFFQAKQIRIGRYKRFQIASKYRLLELLGVGGMGAVYLCEHEFMRRLVAVKVLPVDKMASDPTAQERFYREARAVAALDHPNVVRAHDIDKFENVHFLVMEYVDGASLQEIVARYTMKKQKFDPVRAAHYISQAAAGLQHAGELGLIHRDIKPGNLMLSRTGIVKVLDMGLARFFDHRQDDLTQRFDDQCVLGTADYLAPEQAMQDTVDARADIYGLGGTLYYMLTGYSPFPDGTVAQKLVAHQKSQPKAVTSLRDDVPPELLKVLAKMMAKKPGDRYQTPMEVIEALAPWTAQPVAVPPDSEMPPLSPAVLALMNANPIPGRSGSSWYPVFAATGSGSSFRAIPTDLSESNVATKPSHNAPTAPNHRPKPIPLPAPSRTPWIAVAILSVLLFAALLTVLVLLVR